MKKVNKYQTTESFNGDSERLNSYDNFVALDKQENKIHTKKQSPELHDASIVGDIVMYDKQGAKMVHCKPSEYSIETYPEAQYTPIGVVIIPSSHTDDRKDVIMSLAVMSAQTPDIGVTDADVLTSQMDSGDVLLRFGGQGRQLSGFSKNGKMPYIASCPEGKDSVVSEFGEVQFEVISEDTLRTCVYSNNQLKGTANPSNPSEGYYTMAIDSTKKISKVLLIPSPYTSDGGKNPEYFQAPGDGGNNILADFDGSVINKKYLEQVQGGEGWKTSPTINNESGVQDFPYIQCCWRYHTDGTNQGDWYVPSAGEVGYVCAKFAEIQAGYAKMKELNKTIIDLTDKETASIAHWVSNYNSNIYGFTFAPSISVLACLDNLKDNSPYTSSVAVCRVLL